MKRLLVLIALFSQPLFIYAQNTVAITGVVVDSATLAPLPRANVLIEGSEMGAAANDAGEFVIEHVPPGTYTLLARVIGYESSRQSVTVDSKTSRVVKFTLRESYLQAEKVVVTATRTPKLIENVPVVTELISRREIDNRGSENLADVLQDQPGIRIEETTYAGKTLRLNGMDSKHVLILMDGVPIAGKLNNRLEVNLIDADQIERVEIVKGPGSALYGSEAMGGVINIISRDFNSSRKLSVRGRVGSYDLYSGNVAMSGKQKGVNYYIAFDHMNGGVNNSEISLDITDLYTSGVRGKLGFTTPMGNFRFNGGYQGDTQKSIVQDFMGRRYNTEIDVKRYSGDVNWNHIFNDRFTANLTGYASDYNRDYLNIFSNGDETLDETDENLIGIKSDFAVNLNPQNMIDFGIDYSQDKYESPRLDVAKAERTQLGLFAQYETHPITDLTLSLGGRFDDLSDTESHTSPRVSAMYDFTPQFKFRSSWGGGFRAPSFLDMYLVYENPFFGRVIGNPDLEPEKSTGYSAGLEYFSNRFEITTNYSQTRFTNLIEDYSVAPRLLSYQNIEEATFDNIDVQSRFLFNRSFTADLAYNYSNVDEKAEEDLTSGISPHSITLILSLKLLKERLELVLRDQFYSTRSVKVYNPDSGRYLDQREDQEAYNILNLTANIGIWNTWRIRLGVTNVLDYTDDLYGPFTGRRFFTTLEGSI